MALLVKPWTPDFSSGPYLKVVRLNPVSGSAVSMEPVWYSLPLLQPPLVCVLFLSLSQKKTKKQKKQNHTKKNPTQTKTNKSLLVVALLSKVMLACARLTVSFFFGDSCLLHKTVDEVSPVAWIRGEWPDVVMGALSILTLIRLFSSFSGLEFVLFIYLF